jgi:translation initiation factor 2-alpha kinase 4
LEDEYFKGALQMMGESRTYFTSRLRFNFYLQAKPDSAHHQTALATLFKQPPRPSRAFIYDLEAEFPEYASLNETVQDRLAAIFHLHGAVDMEPPLLMPITDPEEAKNQATFIDRYGDIVALPNNILVAFARLAARESIRRIKRYHIMNVFRPRYGSCKISLQNFNLMDMIIPIFL